MNESKLVYLVHQLVPHIYLSTLPLFIERANSPAPRAEAKTNARPKSSLGSALMYIVLFSAQQSDGTRVQKHVNDSNT